MKKIISWAKTRKGISILSAIIVSIIIATFAIITNQQNVYKAEQEAIKSTNVSIVDQTYIVAASGISPVDWVPTDLDKEVGFLPVEALPSNYLIDKINSNVDYIENASINQLSGTLSFSVTNNTNSVIYAGTLLDTQISEVSNIFVEKNIPVFVVNPNSILNVLNKNVNNVAPTRFGATGYNSYSSSLPSNVSNLETKTVDIPQQVASINPYVQAVKNKGKLISNAATQGGQNIWVTIGLFFGISILLWILVGWFFRRAAAKNMESSTSSRDGRKNIGGVRNRNAEKNEKENNYEDIPATRFTDIAGCDEAIEEMTELVQFLKEPEKFSKVGAKPARGALLVGPPGTGKTLLARAVAGEAGVPFYAVAGSDFVEMYVGVGAKRVRELFSKARAHEEGAIIFIDEIDAIGRKRQSGDATGANTEAEGTLNALLVEMDGFAQNNIIVLGATNRDDILDTALTRPGRLDRKVQVPLPDRAGRERILQVHSRNKPLAEDVDLNLMARRTPGMSGAELEQLVNEACMTAARAGREIVTPTDFDHAVATVAMGKARHSAIVTPHDRAVTAWHEGGHTVAAMVIEEADEPVSVSIIPRGPAGGVTWMAPGDDIFLTRRRAFARLVVAMGGRAAEEIYLDGEFTSGPHGDLSSATQTAMAMVTQYGMTEAGLMIKSDGLLSTGSKVTDETIHAVEALLAEALEVAREVLRENRTLLENVVEALLENDTLSHAELVELRGGKKFEANMPSAPTNYRKEKVLVEDKIIVPVERVRFAEEKSKKRRLLKFGKIEIYLPEKQNKKLS